MPAISIGVGSFSFKAEIHTETTEAVGSNLLANNDIHITDKKDSDMKGSQIIGDNVSMNAGENITLSAAENRSSSDTKESSKSSQAGMSFAPTGNSFYANASKGQGNETEGIFTHTSSQVIARKDLTTESGKDTTFDEVQKESELYVSDQDSAVAKEEKAARNRSSMEIIKSSVSAGIISDPATMKNEI